MKNKKGFTLVELLAVIIVLGIIGMIAIPTVNNIIKNSKENAKEINKKMVLKGAESWVSENINSIPKRGFTLITVTDLIDKGYVNTDTNELTEDIIDECVKISYISKYNNYEYKISSCDDNINIDCFTYDVVNDDTDYVIITGYAFDDPTFCPMDVVIPATINEYPVEKIGEDAFTNNTTNNNRITSVDFSYATNLNEIGRNSFYNNNITTLDFSNLNLLKKIGKNSFKENQIENIIFNNTLEEINGSAFAYNNLTSVSLPSSLITINGAVFWNNNITGTLDLTNLTNITKIGGYSYDDGLYAIGVFEYNNITKVLLPDNIIQLGDGTFKNNNITEVNLPNNLEIIGRLCFENNNIKSDLIFPKSLKEIRNSAFYSALDTAKIDFSKTVNLTKIDYKAFRSNTSSIDNIVDLSGNSKLATIEYESFYDIKVKSVNLKNLSSLKYIEENAFNNCGIEGVLDLSGATSLQIIEKHAFRSNKITSVIMKDLTSLKYIKLGVFLDNQITGTVDLSGLSSLVYLGDSGSESGNWYYGPFENNQIEKVILPSGPSFKIYDAVFKDNKITSVDLGNSVTYVGKYSFYNNSIQNLVFPDTVTQLRDYAFAYNDLRTVEIGANMLNYGPKTLVILDDSNANLTSIINGTGQSLNWSYAIGIGSSTTCRFISGTCMTVTVTTR